MHEDHDVQRPGPVGAERRTGAVAQVLSGRRTPAGRRLAALLTALTLAVSGLVVATPAHAHTPYCGIRWGTLPEQRTPGSTGAITDVRTGRHACFDRLVIQVSGDADGYFVRYVRRVRQDGSGTPVPVRGGARLEVIVTAPPIPTDSWFLPNGELLDPRGYRTFRHLAWAGAFEGQSTFGLGVRARLPFRVFTLDGPGTGSRVVVDVAHRW
jgi:hypothetical protein